MTENGKAFGEWLMVFGIVVAFYGLALWAVWMVGP